MQTCALCNGNDFEIQDGFYFCNTCQTQNEDIREEVYDGRFDATTRLRRVKIKTKIAEETDVIGWTSWELYNFALIGLTNQLIEIGADPAIKLTVLQLWSYYLTKLEVAFVSKNKNYIPKLSLRYHKKDANIIYGKIRQKKFKKKKEGSKTSTSSMISSLTATGSVSTRELNKSKKLLAASEYQRYIQSEENIDNDELSSFSQSSHSSQSNLTVSNSSCHKIRFNKKAKLEAKRLKIVSKKVPYKSKFKKHISTQYATGSGVITPLKLLSILYLALGINNSKIYISDLIRFCRESHLSYYNLDHLIPSEVTLDKSDITLLTQTTVITHKGVRRTAANIAKFLNVCELADPDFLTLIKRFCEDLELPRGVSLYAERLYLSSPSVMKFTLKSSLIPNYEGRAMAYIIVVLKILFGLDDITENEISRVIGKINRIATDKNVLTGILFNFCEWQRFIECRKNALVNVHFPTKLKYDPEQFGTPHLYLRFMGLMKSKRETNVLETDHKSSTPQNLLNIFSQCIDKLNDKSIPLKEMEIFPPSFTPLRSYTTQLLENPFFKIPDILKINFYETKVGYMTKPSSLVELASQCGIKLKVVDCSLHYLEKIVPPFQQSRIPTLVELSKLVKVESSTNSKEHKIKTENLLDYSHRNRPCKLKVNPKSLKYYSLISNKLQKENESSDLDEDNFVNGILPNGRLNIENSDSEDENILNKSNTTSNTKYVNNIGSLNKEFFDKCNIKLYNHEIESLLNTKEVRKNYVPCRDTSGKFKKQSPKSQQKVSKKKQNNEVLNVPLDCTNLSDSDSNDDIDVNNSEESSSIDSEIFFRPYKNYWMYHCIFSRVKEKNFNLFEMELPRNFLWLLNECAEIVEMTAEDLYEEVCLIEAFHFNVLESGETNKDSSDYNFHAYESKSYSKNIINKW